MPLGAFISRTGSAAIDLAYVAAGRLDAFWEFGLKPWDMAAGTLLDPVSWGCALYGAGLPATGEPVAPPSGSMVKT